MKTGEVAMGGLRNKGCLSDKEIPRCYGKQHILQASSWVYVTSYPHMRIPTKNILNENLDVLSP